MIEGPIVRKQRLRFSCELQMCISCVSDVLVCVSSCVSMSLTFNEG